MATDSEITKKYASFKNTMEKDDAIISLYRHAENAGRQEGISSLEKELLNDSTIEAALKTIGWGRGRKESLIATRAVMRGICQIAIEKIKKEK